MVIYNGDEVSGISTSARRKDNRMMFYSFEDAGCILLRNADATTRPVSLSRICMKRLVDWAEGFGGKLTSQRDDMTRPPRAIEVLTIRRHVPLKSLS